jgi:hypothetical protein
MVGTDLQHFSINPGAIAQGLNETLKELDPPLQGSDDPRLPVIMKTLSAMGIEVTPERTLVLDPGKAEALKTAMQARIDETTSRKALGRIFKGDFNLYMFVALKRLPMRVLIISERELDATKGNNPENQRELLAENPAIISETDWKRYRADRGQRDLFLQEKINVPMRRDIQEVAEHALTYEPSKIAAIAAEAAIVIQMRDSIIKADNLHRLEGVLSKKEDGRSQGEIIIAALLDDFKSGRLSTQDFGGGMQGRLERILGIIAPLGNEEFIAILEDNLERLRKGRKLEERTGSPASFLPDPRL